MIVSIKNIILNQIIVLFLDLINPLFAARWVFYIYIGLFMFICEHLVYNWLSEFIFEVVKIVKVFLVDACTVTVVISWLYCHELIYSVGVCDRFLVLFLPLIARAMDIKKDAGSGDTHRRQPCPWSLAPCFLAALSVCFYNAKWYWLVAASLLESKDRTKQAHHNL